MPTFDLQGHRAHAVSDREHAPFFRGRLDLGVTTVETDLHLTRDGVVVLCHDPLLDGRTLRPQPPPGTRQRPESGRTAYLPRRPKPDPAHFPAQDAEVTPLAALFSAEHGIDPYAIPTLAELFLFARDYAGALRRKTAGKTAAQRERAQLVRFDLELKRVPFFPQAINDSFTGREPALLERRWWRWSATLGSCPGPRCGASITAAYGGCASWNRPYDGRAAGSHRAGVSGGVARQARAELLCPGYEFVDEELLRRCREAGVRVVPWTVNDPAREDGEWPGRLGYRRADDRFPRPAGGLSIEVGRLVLNRGSRIEDRGSRIEDRGSRIEDRGSRIEDRGSQDRSLISILDPRSSILEVAF